MTIMKTQHLLKTAKRVSLPPIPTGQFSRLAPLESDDPPGPFLSLMMIYIILLSKMKPDSFFIACFGTVRWKMSIDTLTRA